MFGVMKFKFLHFVCRVTTRINNWAWYKLYGKRAKIWERFEDKLP